MHYQVGGLLGLRKKNRSVIGPNGTLRTGAESVYRGCPASAQQVPFAADIRRVSKPPLAS